MTQYYSRIDTTLNGDVYNIPFSYMKESEISVYINNEPITAWKFLNESQIKINEMPSEIPADAIVSIRRTTDITKKVVDYTNQSMLKKENLNLSQNQLLNAVQEIYDNNVQFEIDTENNILQNRTEIDAQIEANKKDTDNQIATFKADINATIADNKQEVLGIQAGFEQKVNTTIETVTKAAEKINNLEQAVEEAKTAAQTATIKADETQEVLVNAVTEMDSKLTIAESSMDSRLSSATATMNEKLSAANTAVENATQQANLATQKAQEILDINPANTNLSNLTEAGLKVIKDNSGSGLELCDIGMALYVDETKGLRRYLNGQIVDINTNTQAFLNRLKDITTLYPSLLCTEEEWQTAKTMSAFGQVGKFVFNYNGADIVSVRLPRVVNIQGVFDLQNLGMTVDESLPNITGSAHFSIEVDSNPNMIDDASGAFTRFSSGTTAYRSFNGNTATAENHRNLGFNASLSSSTYQDDAPVQPEAIQYPYFIQIATGSETENNIINEIELNNPYSLFDSKYSDHELNNLSWLKSEGQWNAKAVYTDAYDKLLKVYNGTETVEGLSVKLSTVTYTDYDFVLNTADETFRLPLKNHTADDSIEGLTLYYYVGETVQNANLIDAGRIGEVLATKTDMLQASGAGMPSNRYINLALQASGTVYTAPANGYYQIAKNSTASGQYVLIGHQTDDGSTGINGVRLLSSAKDQSLATMLPCKKGDKIVVVYTAGGNTDWFRFIYAEGN